MILVLVIMIIVGCSANAADVNLTNVSKAASAAATDLVLGLTNTANMAVAKSRLLSISQIANSTTNRQMATNVSTIVASGFALANSNYTDSRAANLTNALNNYALRTNGVLWGNTIASGTIIASNGLAYRMSNAFIGNLVIVTNNPQIYCVNGTNQLITLPDCTKIPVGQIIRFSSTNGYASFVLTNATGSQTIRDGSSLDYKSSGVSSVAFFNDGSAWWIASKAKTIWPNASWSTSTNVPFAVAGSNYITFDTLETSNAQGISLTNGRQIYVRDPGQYLLTFSLVMQVGHNNDTNRVWLQQSGINIPRTRTDVKMTSTAEQTVMTVNFILPVTTNLTWFGICLRSTDTGAQLVTGAAASAIMPAMPSAIVTVNKISDTFP